MSLRSIFVSGLITLVSLTAASGCKPFKLKPPAGFAEVDNHRHGAHMKGSDDVGLKVSVFDNVKGGTLAFWSHDLVEKLGRRGYVLTSQKPATSANGVHGTRFDFDYVPQGTDGPKRFYSAVLFATDRNLIVVQLAGKAELQGTYSSRMDEIAAATKTRGCRAGSKICKSEQPGSLTALAAAPAATLADGNP
ncbi:MAG: hypothetical protein JKY37_14965 [Nannocystaceae bacterium]|nr:hypothetical protein [Nannocystaceae bacterium]